MLVLGLVVLIEKSYDKSCAHCHDGWNKGLLVDDCGEFADAKEWLGKEECTFAQL